MKKNETKIHLRCRWTSQAAAEGNLIVAGQEATLPFGKTESGRVDLRGLPVVTRRLVGVTLRKLDLSASRTDGFVFAECEIEGCCFEFVDWPWSDYKSSFKGCSFRGAKFHPGGFGGSRFIECDFGEADMAKLSCSRPRFEGCSFESAKLDSSEMGGSFFESCHFDGTIRNCTFSGTGGGFFRCDLSRVVFLECDFKMMRMKNCTLAPEQLWYDGWPGALAKIEAALAGGPEAAAPLLSAWREQVRWHPTHLIDLRHIHKKYPSEVAAALEHALRLGHSGSSHPGHGS